MSEDVWVVDDERSILDAMVIVLREHGLGVRGFSDPTRAIDAALRDPPRVILTDYSMPQLDGVTLARTLRERLASECPRLVLVSAHDVRRVERTLFDAVVQKPFRLAELVVRVNAFLTPRAVRRASSHLRLRATAAGSRAGGDER